jgi:predicted DNA-binding transcriptional regulator AlpA
MIKLLRFPDLQEHGIVDSWAQLGNLIRKQGFPQGRMIGLNSRAWTETEVADWLASRPTAGPPPRGAAKAGRGRPRKAAKPEAAKPEAAHKTIATITTATT